MDSHYPYAVHSLDKIKATIDNLSPDDAREMVVLVSTGAYCPVHKMHIRMFEIAKDYLEKTYDYNVIAGFISPSHNDYVSKKLRNKGEPFITANHRVAMCALAADESESTKSWITADSWESDLEIFIGSLDVAADIDKTIHKQIPHHRFKVMYLCGADLVVRCHGMKSFQRKYTVIAVGREKYTEKCLELQKEKNLTNIIFLTDHGDDVSSTQIREYLRTGKPVDELTFPSVVNYLKEHNLM